MLGAHNHGGEPSKFLFLPGHSLTHVVDQLATRKSARLAILTCIVLTLNDALPLLFFFGFLSFFMNYESSKLDRLPASISWARRFTIEIKSYRGEIVSAGWEGMWR